MTRMLKYLSASSVLALTVLGANPALAAGTAAGTDITNNVTVNFQVGGNAQTAEAASDTFKVDRKVNLTVAEVGTTTTSVSPNQQDAVTSFTVQNTSNATLDFALSAAQGAAIHGGTDNFDVTGLSVFVESGATPGYQPSEDTATFINALGADQTATVYIIGDIPISQVTGDVAGVVLTATAHESTTAALDAVVTQTAGADDAAVVDTVFADTAGETDANRDGKHSAGDDYTVLAADVTVSKISTVISDPFNGTTNPKAIPGAVVEYCITVSNAAGGADATNVAITDTLPANLTFDSGFGILLNGTITGSVPSHTCNADGTAGGSFTAGDVTGTIATVASGAARTLVFRATVD